MEKLLLENQYKIVVPLFGAAFAAPNKGTTILYWFGSQSTVLIPTENRRILWLFKAFEWFSSTFLKADLIFKDFSRKPSKFKYFSSLCEPCTREKISQPVPAWESNPGCWIYRQTLPCHCKSRLLPQDSRSVYIIPNPRTLAATFVFCW